MQNDQIQEPVAEADGERLRPHAVSTHTCLLKLSPDSSTTEFLLQTVKNRHSPTQKHTHVAPASCFKAVPSCVRLSVLS